LERELNVVGGGFILGGKDFHETVEEEYIHFEKEFQSKVNLIAKEKEIRLGNISSLNFITAQLSNSTNYLMRVGNMTRKTSDRVDRTFCSQ